MAVWCWRGWIWTTEASARETLHPRKCSPFVHNSNLYRLVLLWYSPKSSGRLGRTGCFKVMSLAWKPFHSARCWAGCRGRTAPFTWNVNVLPLHQIRIVCCCYCFNTAKIYIFSEISKYLENFFQKNLSIRVFYMFFFVPFKYVKQTIKQPIKVSFYNCDTLTRKKPPR